MKPAPPVSILVVEDDVATGEFFADLLSMYGYHVTIVTNGRDALTYLAADQPDLIVLDWRLPDMDGLAICRHVRTTLKANVPIILMTADHSLSLDDAARSAGATQFMTKPFDPSTLIEHIAALAGTS